MHATSSRIRSWTILRPRSAWSRIRVLRPRTHASFSACLDIKLNTIGMLATGLATRPARVQSGERGEDAIRLHRCRTQQTSCGRSWTLFVQGLNGCLPLMVQTHSSALLCACFLPVLRQFSFRPAFYSQRSLVPVPQLPQQLMPPLVCRPLLPPRCRRLVHGLRLRQCRLRPRRLRGPSRNRSLGFR
jgi:hypothetical protein